ncbi:hypothetical protein L484_016810 [Morus notabilis]|uniref:Amino acid transporter transmembrane domain-containing protein n=1 Tax=Morus notabilis TaxID=981085 RepID=W9SCG9_9ROSA|nr:hypothetical protein L484_016810 [Morus notabilis]
MEASNGTGVRDSPKELDAGAMFVLKSKELAKQYNKKAMQRKLVFSTVILTFLIHGQLIVRVLAALWVPLDNINSGTSASESSICPGIAGLGWRSDLPGFGRLGHFLFLQPLVIGSGAPCEAWTTSAPVPRHGVRYFRIWGIDIYIYLVANPDGKMKLYQFISMFGGVVLVLAQMPSFHSLRHINLVSLILCLAFSACAAAGSIYIGHSKDAPTRDYSVTGSDADRVFGTFNAISIIATTYASGIIPEIQATIAPPVQGKMLKGLCVCYSVIATTYLSVGISGYWAFGNQAQGTLLSNFIDAQKISLLPSWFVVMINIFTLTQVLAVTLVYLQPTNEVFENNFADPKKDQFSARNVIPRLIFRSLSVIIATLFAAMLPFFGDLMALFGAFGCIPLDFILPMIFYNVTFMPSKRGLIFWVNTLIAAASLVLVGIGSIASVRQIILDAKEYRLFANM